MKRRADEWILTQPHAQAALSRTTKKFINLVSHCFSSFEPTHPSVSHKNQKYKGKVAPHYALVTDQETKSSLHQQVESIQKLLSQLPKESEAPLGEIRDLVVEMLSDTFDLWHIEDDLPDLETRTGQEGIL